MKRKQYHLTDQQIKQLDKVAQDTGLSVSEHVRRAVDEYLERKQSDGSLRQPSNTGMGKAEKGLGPQRSS